MNEIYEPILLALIERGWKLVEETETSQTIAIMTIIPDWKSLTWAQQAYYKGKYRFSEKGTLVIGLWELGIVCEKTDNHSALDVFQQPHILPDTALEGSNDRLKRILDDCRVGHESRSYDDTALLHVGPDGTAIYTNQIGWGPPIHWTDEGEYVELNPLFTCYWEIGPSWVSEPPWWACPPFNGS